MNSSVFTYGTLAIDEVMHAVTGRQFPHREAVLEGYSAYLVRGQMFPAIVPDPNGSTPGVLYDEVDPATLNLLDRFEGELYQRLRVGILDADGATIEAHAYSLGAGDRDKLTAEPWDPAGFSARHLARYLAACREFRTSHTP